MNLTELLKNLGIEDEVIVKILDEMKANKMYLSSEENVDVRYGKLKDKLKAKESEMENANKLIEELKAGTASNEELQEKIKTYEAETERLKEELKQATIDNALKLALMNAKATDIDYLSYKIKNGNNNLQLDEKGNIEGVNGLIEDFKKVYPQHFEKEETRKIEENKLPSKREQTAISQEDFKNMSYKERNDLYNTNKELYDELRGETNNG